MPRYIYECDACNKTFEMSHGMFHLQDICILCKRRETIIKIPNFTIKKAGTITSPARTGKVVDEFIVEAKKDLKQQKKELKSEKL